VTGASGSEAFEGGCCYKVGAVLRWVLLQGGCCLEVGAVLRWVLLQGGCCKVSAATRWVLQGGCCKVGAATNKQINNIYKQIKLLVLHKL